MDIVFVVLHYMAIQETLQSVQYIEKNVDTPHYHIVIVDNASGNGTGEQLKQEYQGRDGITVILSPENRGFAGGNNIGFIHAKNRWDPRYIVLMNNDVFLLEKDLLRKLDKEYVDSGFAVLGPMIMTKDGRCDVNPQQTVFSTSMDIEKRIQHYKKDLKRYQYHYAPLYYKLAAMKGVLCKKPVRKDKDYLKRAENVKLHGCFLVFSQEYIRSFDGLDESTFLFWEEEFLYKHMTSHGKRMVYCPEIVVFHMEDAATDASLSGRRDKMLFMLTNYIKSLEELKRVYDEYELKGSGSDLSGLL